MTVAGRLADLVAAPGVLGLGEPTHGTAEAFAWKWEVILDLARRGVLTSLAWELEHSIGQEVDRVLREGGDVTVPWATSGRLWDTATIVSGLRALQRHNLSVPPDRRVCFVGVDIRRPHLAARALADRGIDPPVVRALAAQQELSEHDKHEAIALGARLGEGDDPVAAALGRQLARYVDAYELEPDLARLHRRDVHMASTLLEHLPADGLTVLWAHNEHIATSPDFFGGPSLGQVLSDRLGARYAGVGILCGPGRCRAVDPSSGPEYTDVELPPLGARCTEHALARAGSPLVLTDRFAHPGPRRFVGWRVDTAHRADETCWTIERPAADFAALAYLPRSSADVARPRAAR